LVREINRGKYRELKKLGRGLIFLMIPQEKV
jgi:hypothetical protein